MAKKSAIERNNKRRKLKDRFAAKRAELKGLANDRSLPMEERFAARLKLAKLPRNSSPGKQRRSVTRWLAIAAACC